MAWIDEEVKRRRGDSEDRERERERQTELAGCEASANNYWPYKTAMVADRKNNNKCPARCTRLRWMLTGPLPVSDSLLLPDLVRALLLPLLLLLLLLLTLSCCSVLWSPNDRCRIVSFIKIQTGSPGCCPTARKMLLSKGLNCQPDPEPTNQPSANPKPKPAATAAPAAWGSHLG